MPSVFAQLFQDLQARARAYGIEVQEVELPPERPGRFDGVTVLMNRTYDPEERCHYLAHAIGSIVRWSLDPAGCTELFRQLDEAKAHRATEPAHLDRALAEYRDYETAASEYAVWLLADLGYESILPAYTNFARADLAAMEQMHRTGTAPAWRDFFAAWNGELARGERQVRPYVAERIPPFQPVRMREQGIVQNP